MKISNKIYRFYGFAIIIIAVILISYQILLPTLLFFVEKYPNLILISAILESFGLLVLILDYVLTLHFIKFSYDVEECDDIFYCLAFSFLHFIELLIKIMSIVLIWIYFSQQSHGLYIANMIITVVGSLIGITVIILQYNKFYHGSKEHADTLSKYKEI